MKMKLFLAMMSLASVLALCNGCLLLAAGAGVGGCAYVEGELKEGEATTLDRAYDASLAAMSDLQYVVVSKSKDASAATIIGRTGNDTKVQVKLSTESSAVIEIRIRFGTFGDESRSRQLLDKIKSHL